MSYCAAVPGIESDSHVLIDACLARVRVDARLDEEPVLPPLEVLFAGQRKDRLDVYGQTQHVPSADAIVRSLWSVRRATQPDIQGAAHVSSVGVRTISANRGSRPTLTDAIPRALRWPVFLCGFVAGIFGGMALMKSPVGQTPTMRHAMVFAKHQATTAYLAAGVVKSSVLGQ